MKVVALIPDRCTGCLRCELACSYAQTGSFQPARSVIRVSPFEGYTSYAPYTCPQCPEGWCMTACPVGAIQINAAGAKDVIDDICVGCKLCTIACPFGSIRIRMLPPCQVRVDASGLPAPVGTTEAGSIPEI